MNGNQNDTFILWGEKAVLEKKKTGSFGTVRFSKRNSVVSALRNGAHRENYRAIHSFFVTFRVTFPFLNSYLRILLSVVLYILSTYDIEYVSMFNLNS